MSTVDFFYPFSKNINNMPQGMWQMDAAMRLRHNLTLAKKGDMEAERRIINRIGTIRRSVNSMQEINQDLLEVIKEAADYLRSTGRKVDLSNKDPRYWITRRDGSPRW